MRILLAIVVIAFLILIAAIGFSWKETGNPVPVCEKYQVLLAQDRAGEWMYIMDETNILKLMALINGVADGTCRLE